MTSSSSSPSLSSHSDPRSTSHSPKASGLVAPEGESNGRYQSYPPDSRRTTASPHRCGFRFDSPETRSLITLRARHSNSISSFHSSRSNDPLGYNFVAPTQPLQHARHSSQQYSSRLIQLFDPEHPQRPHPTLTPHFIQLFFEHFGAEFTFLSYEEILAEYWDQLLPPLLANCIASMASR